MTALGKTAGHIYAKDWENKTLLWTCLWQARPCRAPLLQPLLGCSDGHLLGESNRTILIACGGLPPMQGHMLDKVPDMIWVQSDDASGLHSLTRQLEDVM